MGYRKNERNLSSNLQWKLEWKGRNTGKEFRIDPEWELIIIEYELKKETGWNIDSSFVNATMNIIQIIV